ncbi:TetR/AcrR family transcriptional regulator [Holdemania massiliensis]|uniref:TetR/AcrR family transcriptional regulator n=1 Tax=Holdemania massiliensis TaxID=1468449 RepID=UPI001F070E6A|nr:TetR family transcriptional regulator [Holdemania massiliensis]MCH1942450.1 TetR/AcrR family transcriptional regulator [Holdemania massiliensis]
MQNQKDRRCLRSEKAIKAAFHECLLSVGFEAMTVKELAEKADISRKTFYLHYDDKYDLLKEITEEMIGELEVLCEKKKDLGLAEGTVLWFRYFDERKAFFTALFTADNTTAFRSRLMNFMMEQIDIKLIGVSQEKNTKVLRKFMAMAVLGVLESCVLGQLDGNVDETAMQVGELLDDMIKRACRK